MENNRIKFPKKKILNSVGLTEQKFVFQEVSKRSLKRKTRRKCEKETVFSQPKEKRQTQTQIQNTKEEREEKKWNERQIQTTEMFM